MLAAQLIACHNATMCRPSDRVSRGSMRLTVGAARVASPSVRPALCNALARRGAVETVRSGRSACNAPLSSLGRPRDVPERR